MSYRSRLKRAARYIWELHRQLDPVVMEGIKGHDIQCVEGCNHCCKQVVTITIPEALAILWEPLMSDMVVNHLQGRLGSRLKEQVRYCYDPSTSITTWFDEGISCLFLKGGRCMVYERRPVACRTHYVVSDPELCAPPSGRGTYSINVAGAIEAVTASSMRAVTELQTIMGMAPMPVALNHALFLIHGGSRALNDAVKGTPEEDDISGAFYWGRRFTSPEDFQKMLAMSIEDTEGLA